MWGATTVEKFRIGDYFESGYNCLLQRTIRTIEPEPPLKPGDAITIPVSNTLNEVEFISTQPIDINLRYFVFAANDMLEIYNENNMSISIPTTLYTSRSNIIQSNIELYPNPASDYLYLENNDPNAHFSIFNTSGFSIIKGHVVNSKINISKLSLGVYILYLETNKGLHPMWFVKGN